MLHVLDHGLPLQNVYTLRTRSILKAEEAKGWTITTVTGPRHGAAPAARESVDGLDFFRTVPPPKTMSPIGELREIGAFAARIGEAIDAFKPDLLHAHSPVLDALARSEEHTSELQSLMRISYAVFCLKKKRSKAPKKKPTPIEQH